MEIGMRHRASGRPRKGLQICFQCRNRKVRCDGAPGGCENCRRLKFHCSFAVPGDFGNEASTQQVDPSHLRLEKRRVSRACFECRDKKTKCCGTQPTCRRCLRKGVVCQYPEASKAQSAATVAPGTHQQAATPLSGESVGHYEVSVAPSPASTLSFELSSNKTIIKQHIDAFFDFVYPIPCYGFVHKATFCQSWAQDTHNPRLLKAMCGLTARYIAAGDSARLQQATRWTQEAEMQLFMRLGEPSMSDIEALMLTTIDHIIARRFSKMLISACLAARLAYMMKLNYEDGRLSFITQERRRRLMWAIFTLDTLYSSGKAEFTGCSKDTIHLQLPCNERPFTLDLPVVTEPLNPPESRVSTDLGFMAYNIRVLDIRDRIQRLCHTITHRRKPLPECIARLKGLADELEILRRSLPQSYTFDKKNLFLRAYTPQRTSFVMFHAWWHQCQCDMYRFTIPGFREGLSLEELGNLSPDLVACCRDRCLEHALAVADIMGTVTETGTDIFVTDPALAMCAFHSAPVISRLGSPPFSNLPRDVVIAKLKACWSILETPSEMYPTARLLRGGVSDLIHDAERNSGDSSPLRSSWETEQAGSGGDARAAATASASSAEVYSKFSVTDEIRKLKFRQDGEDSINRYEQDRESGSLMNPFALAEISRADGAQPYMALPQCIPAGFPDASYGTHPAPYDVSMTLGFEPSYGDCQPDLFLDTFMPLQSDWNMADSGCF